MLRMLGRSRGTGGDGGEADAARAGGARRGGELAVLTGVGYPEAAEDWRQVERAALCRCALT